MLLDIRQLVQEFYAMEAVSAMIQGNQYSCFQPMRHSHSRWHSDFMEFQKTYISQFAAAIYDYTVLVVAAELRHGKRQASRYIKDYYTTAYGREDVYRDCACYKAHDILLAGLHLFDPAFAKWNEAYGGKKWFYIAKAGLLKGTVSDEVFIDHCVDLSHNNSIYFDKSAGIFCLQETRLYQEFLDHKRICEPQALIKGQFGYCLNRLLLRAAQLGILPDYLPGCRSDHLFPLFSTQNESDLLTYQPVHWGNIPLNCSDENIGVGCFYSSQRLERSDYDDYRLEQCA